MANNETNWFSIGVIVGMFLMLLLFVALALMGL